MFDENGLDAILNCHVETGNVIDWQDELIDAGCEDESKQAKRK
jgi:hypothetical protein